MQNTSSLPFHVMGVTRPKAQGLHLGSAKRAPITRTWSMKMKGPRTECAPSRESVASLLCYRCYATK